MTLIEDRQGDSGEHDALDDELVARLGPPPTFHLDGRDPAARAAGWLVAVMAALVFWLLIGLVVLVLFF